MQLDLKTVAIITGLTHFIQMIIFAQQYYSNRESKEIKWWLYWSLCINISMTASYFRDLDSVNLRNMIIIIQNFFIGAGVIFLYVGVMKFFRLRAYKEYLYGVFLFLLAIIVFFTYISDNIYIRSIVINLYLSLFGLLPAYIIFKNRHKTRYSASNLVMITLFIHGSFFLFRTLIIASGGLNLDNMFEGNLINHLTFIDAISMGVIWTFGFIVLHNEKLSIILNETKDKFQSLFNTSPDITIITSLNEGRIVEANEIFFKVSGYSKEEALGSSTISIMLWKNLSDRENIVNNLMKKKCLNNLETEFVKKDGAPFIGLVSAVLMDVDNEKVILSIVRDVTDLRKLEREKVAEAVKWEKTFNAISDSLFILDAEGKILNHNSQSCRTFGEKNMKGMHVCDVVHGGNGHTEACPASGIKHISKSESSIIEHEGKWYEITLDPIVSGNEPAGAVYIVTDITKKKITDENISKSLKELKEMNEIMVNREIKMTELKNEINELLKACGKEPKY
jgi:PAS domain S-box-containing protein